MSHIITLSADSRLCRLRLFSSPRRFVDTTAISWVNKSPTAFAVYCPTVSRSCSTVFQNCPLAPDRLPPRPHGPCSDPTCNLRSACTLHPRSRYTGLSCGRTLTQKQSCRTGRAAGPAQRAETAWPASMQRASHLARIVFPGPTSADPLQGKIGSVVHFVNSHSYP